MLFISAVLLACMASVSGKIHPIEVIYIEPEQVHIAFGDSVREIVVTWSTMNKTEQSIVEYGISSMNETAHGSAVLFTDGGTEQRSQWIHRVTLRNLEPNSLYNYHCGSIEAMSNQFTFKTPPSGNDWTVRAAIYGDMGNINAQSLRYLQEEAQGGAYDVVLHVGDFAYDMDSENARVGDEFMRQIEPLAAYVPYMTCPGNHEEKYNFSNYKSRFSMPGPFESMMYSFDLGPVHFVSISTEFYYFLNYGVKQLATQFKWLEADLKNATSETNRAIRPWVVVFGHRPMYCSNSDDLAECAAEFTRTGPPFFGYLGLEKMLYEFGVDVLVWAHEHSYERTWPLYNNTVYNGTDKPYHNPRAPVHIVTGSAGCQEKTDPFVKEPKPWSAFRATDYGYTRFRAFNRTHLHLEQVSVDKNGSIIDEVWIVKDKHESYLHNPSV